MKQNTKNISVKDTDIASTEQILSQPVPYPHSEIEEVIKNNDIYINDYIMAKFPEIPKDSDGWWLLNEFCHGAILANVPSVLNFTVTEHYHDKDGTDYFVVQKTYNTVHYFAIHHGNNRDFIRYDISDFRDLNQCKNSVFIGKKLGETVTAFNIPTLSGVLRAFKYSDNIYNYLP